MSAIVHPSSRAPLVARAAGARTPAALGGALVALGVAAIVVPPAAGLATDPVVGAVLLVSGLLGFVPVAAATGVFPRCAGGLVSGLSVLTGLALLIAPTPGGRTPMLVLAGLFALDGLLHCHRGWKLGDTSGAARPAAVGWLVVGGAVSIQFGAMILGGWPGSAAWAIGPLVGLKLLSDGVAPFLFGGASNAAESGRARNAFGRCVQNRTPSTIRPKVRSGECVRTSSPSTRANDTLAEGSVRRAFAPFVCHVTARDLRWWASTPSSSESLSARSCQCHAVADTASFPSSRRSKSG